MRPRSATLAAVVLLAAGGLAFAGCDSYESCPHRVWVKATVTHDYMFPVPDVVSAEVRGQADFNTWGYSPSCWDLSVGQMDGQNGTSDYWNKCFWRDYIDGVKVTDCDEYGEPGPGLWANHNEVGDYTRDGGSFRLVTTVYAAVGRSSSGSCGIKKGSIPPHSRFSCPWRYVF